MFVPDHRIIVPYSKIYYCIWVFILHEKYILRAGTGIEDLGEECGLMNDIFKINTHR